jgi:hypothetical protein
MGRGGGGAESYDRKKAWSSVNHSILSVYNLANEYSKLNYEESLPIERMLFKKQTCIPCKGACQADYIAFKIRDTKFEVSFHYTRNGNIKFETRPDSPNFY